MFKISKGFTLIELLVVVSVVGALAGALVAVIKPEFQRQVAEDAVKKSNIMKLVDVIESFKTAEGFYPNPTIDLSDPVIHAYIQKWPDEPAGATYTYGADSTSFFIYSQSSIKTTEYLKYYSGWPDPELKVCTDISGKDKC